MSKLTPIRLGFFVVLFILSTEHAQAQETTQDSDELTGNWGGSRSYLEKTGISTNLSATTYLQSDLSSNHQNSNGLARIDALLSFDSEKLGLWPSGSLHTHLEYKSGSLSAFYGGAILPVNSAVALPLGGNDRLVLSSFYFSQHFGNDTTLILGKINAVDLLAADPFFGGWGIERFWNLAFVAPPSGVVPPVLMGSVLSHTAGPYKFSAMIYDPNDQTNEYSFNQLFKDGVNIQLSSGWSGNLDSRASSITLTGTYSTAQSPDLAQMGLPADLRTSSKKGAYNVSLQISHLLLESSDTPGKGLGIYGKAAIADGNPNFIQSSFVGGLAAHGVIPGRPRDSAGIGYFNYNFSSTLESALSKTMQLGSERGLEVYYNWSITPWMMLGADLQWIDPAKNTEKQELLSGLRLHLKL